MGVDGMMFAAQQSVLLGCLSIPESFVQIGQSRKKFYFIRKGSKKAGAPMFNGKKMALGTLMGQSSLHTKVFFWSPCQSLKVSLKSNSPEKSFTSYGGPEKQKKKQKKPPRRIIKGAKARGWVLYEAAQRATIKCWWPR